MQPDTGWSTGQRALLRFLEQQGVLTGEPAAPATGKPSNADLFAAFADAIDQQGLVDLVSQALRIGAVDLKGFAPMADLVALIPVEVARRGEVVPIAQYDGTLEVAASNPLDLETVKSVEFTTGLRVRTKVARRADVCRAVLDAYGVAPYAAASETASAEVAAEPSAPAPESDVPESQPCTDVPETQPCDVGPEEIPVDAAPSGPETTSWSFEVEVAETVAHSPDDATVSPDETPAVPDDDATMGVVTSAVDDTTEAETAERSDESYEANASIATPAWTALETESDDTPVWSIDDESLELGVEDVLELGLFDDVRLDDPAVADQGDAEGGTGSELEPSMEMEGDVALDARDEVLVEAAVVIDPDPVATPVDLVVVELDAPENVADLTPIAAPEPVATVTFDRPAVLVVSRDLSRRVAIREALESGVGGPCVLTMRDELEARAVLALGRLGAIVVEGGALAADGRPLWEVLRESAPGVVVWGGRPAAPDVVGLDRDTNAAEVAAQVRALLGESVDD